MALTVVNVAYPLAPVGPDAAGGAEQVLTMIDEALVARGHRSIVVACRGSVVRGVLVEMPLLKERPLELELGAAQRAVRGAIAAALERYRVDVVHLHGVDFMAYLPPPGVATVVTLHLPLELYSEEVRRMERPRTTVVAVSASQRAGALGASWIDATITNGVHVGATRVRARKFGYAIGLGRICSEKGYHRALDAAKRAGVPFVLAGEVFGYSAHRAYFEREIAPRLDARRRFIGPVGRARKRRLLAGARCIVVPSTVPETSSLVAMEALAAGTPVVASRLGALPEIVAHAKTGFLVSNDDELARAIRDVAAIDPFVCRRAAEERFDAEAMVSEYLALYRACAAAS